MARQKMKNVRPGGDTDIVLGGFNIYHDHKNRTIYYNRFNKKGYVIRLDDMRLYRVYSARFIIALAAAVLLFTFTDTFLAIPAIAIGLGVIVYAVMEYKFRMLLRGCTMLANFNPKEAYGQFQILSIDAMGRLVTKIILFLALGVLLILNAYDQGYEGAALFISWVFAAYAAIEAIVQIIAIYYKKTRPIHDLHIVKRGVIKMDMPKKEKKQGGAQNNQRRQNG